jgi:hypothetical protein
VVGTHLGVCATSPPPLVLLPPVLLRADQRRRVETVPPVPHSQTLEAPDASDRQKADFPQEQSDARLVLVSLGWIGPAAVRASVPGEITPASDTNWQSTTELDAWPRWSKIRQSGEETGSN